MKFVLLPTDALLYLLVVAIVFLILWGRRYQHWRMSWRQVFKNRLGMIALIILLIYVSIGLLDSIHFENTKTVSSSQVISLFDRIIHPLGDQDEVTYSAPFALYSYSKATQIGENGSITQTYPRLQFGGATLINPQQRLTDILQRVSIAAIVAFVIWLTISAVFVFYLARKHDKTFINYAKKILLGKTTIAWREILLTLAVVAQVIFISCALATHYHVLGTDKVGNDIFYETIKSIRTGLIIGTLTTLIMLPFAVLLGTVAGYFGGWLDDIIQYIYTTLSSIPGVLLITAAVLALQIFIENHPQDFPTLALRADIRLLALCTILGVTSWTTLCRLIRAETLKLREMDFVAAATVLGTSRTKIILRHILPNVMHIILITVVLDFSGLVLAEAVLSYVGVGVDPSTLSWGNMINSARLELARDPVVWWPLFAAFIFMFVFVLAANLFADAVRDAFDPRLRNME
jgi:peptide/nickel transport system permease protein